jgi:hypothetical protein
MDNTTKHRSAIGSQTRQQLPLSRRLTWYSGEKSANYLGIKQAIYRRVRGFRAWEIVLTQLRQHVERCHVIGIGVGNPLHLAGRSDRAQRRAADLAHALGNGIDGGENLIPLLVEQQVIVAEVRAGDVPIEILGLNVERAVSAPRDRGPHRHRGRSASPAGLADALLRQW